MLFPFWKDTYLFMGGSLAFLQRPIKSSGNGTLFPYPNFRDRYVPTSRQTRAGANSAK
jgi:hypothetical protein